jgi:hypothetical protein
MFAAYRIAWNNRPVWPENAGLRRLRFSFFLDEPARVLPAFGRMSLEARAPSAAEWFRRRA